MNDKIPTPENIALYISSLQLHLKTSKVSTEVKVAIENLPPPNIVKKMGFEECRVVFETIEWLWKNIAGESIIDKENTSKPMEFFQGNYWILKNGIFLDGINHFTILKQNINLFSEVLNVNSSVFLHAMSTGDNNKLIFTAIANGAIRAFFNDKKELFAQMSAATYASWGRNKIQLLEYKEKHIKVIDVNRPYKGWDSGIFVVVE